MRVAGALRHTGFGILAIVAVLTLSSGGCFNSATSPTSTQVELPDGSRITAEAGSGPPSLADSTWAFYDANDALLTVITFGQDGEVTACDENAFYWPDVVGDSLTIDGKVRQTPTEGLTYNGLSFGGENESGFGFSVRLNMWVLGIEGAWGRVYAFGTVDGNQMVGTFGFTTRVKSLVDSPVHRGDSGEFAFYAVREDDVDDSPTDADTNTNG